MENIVLTQNTGVLNQIIKAINEVFRPSNIHKLHPNRELAVHGWDNFYHLRITVDLSKCNKDWLRQILTNHYNSDQYVWSNVSIDLADDGKLNIYFHFHHSMLNIISQFAEVDKVIQQIDRSAISILDPTVTRFVDKGTKIVDGDLCKVYTIYLYDQQSRYYDDFTEAVETRYTQNPFNFHKASVFIEGIGTLFVSLFSKVEDSKMPSGPEYINRLQHPKRFEHSLEQMAATMTSTEVTVPVGVVYVDGDVLEGISAIAGANKHAEAAMKYDVISQNTEKCPELDDSAHPDETHEPSKIDTVDEQLDKVISGIEQLKWLYNQATEQDVHDRINSKINMLVETSVSSISNLTWGEYDPDNKIPAIIEKLQWIRSNTNNANGAGETILALINKLVIVAVRDLME